MDANAVLLRLKALRNSIKKSFGIEADFELASQVRQGISMTCTMEKPGQPTRSLKIESLIGPSYPELGVQVYSDREVKDLVVKLLLPTFWSEQIARMEDRQIIEPLYHEPGLPTNKTWFRLHVEVPLTLEAASRIPKMPPKIIGLVLGPEIETVFKLWEQAMQDERFRKMAEPDQARLIITQWWDLVRQAAQDE